MENTKEPQEQLDSVIIDGNDTIEVSGNEIITSGDDECQRKAFEFNVENYRNRLTSSMREKSTIKISLYNDIINALKCGKGAKKSRY